MVKIVISSFIFLAAYSLPSPASPTTLRIYRSDDSLHIKLSIANGIFFFYPIRRSTPRRRSRSTTASTARSRRTASSRCVRSPPGTPSTSSRAKCTRRARSRCSTFCSSANAGSRASCWWSTRRRSRCATSCCWGSACTRGSRCHCRRRI